MSSPGSPKHDKRDDQSKPKGVPLVMALGIALLAGIAYGLYYGKISLREFQGTRPDQLKQLSSRFQFVLRNITPGLVWFVFTLIYVGVKRGKRSPITTNDAVVQMAKNMAQNTLEQLVLSVCTQLVLVTYLEPRQIITVIPVMNIMFIVGRVLFFLGYPNYRGPGFQMTSFPTIAAIGYVGYRYAKSIF